MRYTLALLALLVLSAPAHADAYQTGTGYGPLYYPDGATVTSVTFDLNSQVPIWELDYSFADGTGVTFDNNDYGDTGYMFFTTPITDATFAYNYSAGPLTMTFYNAQDVPFETLTDGMYASGATSSVDAITFPENVAEIQWVVGTGGYDWGGITSLSYTLDGPDDPAPVPTPEPGSLPFTVLGMTLLGAGFAWMRPPLGR